MLSVPVCLFVCLVFEYLLFLRRTSSSSFLYFFILFVLSSFLFFSFSFSSGFFFFSFSFIIFFRCPHRLSSFVINISVSFYLSYSKTTGKLHTAIQLESADYITYISNSHCHPCYSVHPSATSLPVLVSSLSSLIPFTCHLFTFCFHLKLAISFSLSLPLCVCVSLSLSVSLFLSLFTSDNAICSVSYLSSTIYHLPSTPSHHPRHSLPGKCLVDRMPHPISALHKMSTSTYPTSNHHSAATLHDLAFSSRLLFGCLLCPLLPHLLPYYTPPTPAASPVSLLFVSTSVPLSCPLRCIPWPLSIHKSA